MVTYIADDNGYHATVEYHGDIIQHHQPHSPPPLGDLHRALKPVIKDKPYKYKYSPIPSPAPVEHPLLPKLFVPPKTFLNQIKKPALKLEDPVPVLPLTKRYRYSPTPSPYPQEPKQIIPLRKSPVYKGKIVYLEKP